MDGLHRRDHPELGEARDVLGVEVLGVLDAPAQVRRLGVRREGLLVDVEHLAVGAVADGVDAHLVAVLDRELGDLARAVQGEGVEAGRVGAVAVGLQQPGAARAQGAVEPQLDAAHGQAVVGVVVGAVEGELFFQVVLGAQHHDPQPHAEVALVGRPLQEIDRLEARARVVEGGDAFRQAFLGGELDDLAHLGRGGLRRTGAVDELFGGLAQEARGASPRVLQDVAAFRRLGRLVDAGELHGLGVDEDGVAAGVGEDHRVVGRDGAQRVVEGEALHVGLGHLGPLVLVPAAAADPLARLGVRRGRGHHGDDVVPGFGLSEVELELGVADAREVGVALDEAGNGEVSFEVEDLGGFADQGLDVGAAAHRDDPAVAGGQGLGFGAFVVHGDDLAVDQHEIGGLAFRLFVASVAGRAASGGGQGRQQEDRASSAWHREVSFHNGWCRLGCEVYRGPRTTAARG